ncbi:MAG: hypothetical protein Unbinned3138contig1002_12 [Prokaryotic dsDNA virus sp.]|nr:MAG: hypothetical protein Unbinned3138contig1002_12 [Prokaryotic dsDNA virus sp.]|tara:strand:+ start:10906 stop:11106 length:201 start_codon:yes stop_codon:yes gene_type:complete
MTHEFQDFPLVSEELISALELRFPDKMPLDKETLSDICRLQGQVSVVRLLKDVREEQNNNIFNVKE